MRETEKNRQKQRERGGESEVVVVISFLFPGCNELIASCLPLRMR